MDCSSVRRFIVPSAYVKRQDTLRVTSLCTLALNVSSRGRPTPHDHLWVTDTWQVVHRKTSGILQFKRPLFASGWYPAIRLEIAVENKNTKWSRADDAVSANVAEMIALGPLLVGKASIRVRNNEMRSVFYRVLSRNG